MAKRATIRKRCAECREWFTPPVQLEKHQVVCGASCRVERRRKQARARRRLDPARYREEERERKRRSRASGGASGVGGDGRKLPVGEEGQAPGHAPGEACNPRESRGEFARMWDTLSTQSRAGWEREVRKIAHESWRKGRQATTAGGVGHAPGGFPNARR